MTLVLGEVYRTISRHLIGKAGLSRASGATGAVTLVQRFGSALNLNVHFHMVFLDGAYQTVGAAAPVFRPVAAPESSDMQKLVEQIAGRIGRALERRGLVERDLENAWLVDHLPHRGRTAGGAEALYAADGCAPAAGTAS